MIKKTTALFFLLILTLLFSCEKPVVHPYTFYYWRTTLALDSLEQQTLQAATDDKFYVRYFDVDRVNGQLNPVGIATKETSFQTSKEIVPVVFITNRSFLNISKEEITFLAKSILKLVESKEKEFGFPASKELQIDCDWNQGTRQDYFKFLQLLEEYSGKKISVTLRLHQVRYKEKTGIPPVDKVYLMCYSTSSPLENSDKNSILDVALLKSYLRNLDAYPIKKIDVALPIYSWGIVTNHLGKHKLINGLSSSDLEQEGLERTSDNTAVVQKDGFYFGFFLNEGFQIKIEEISKNQLDESLKYLNKKLGDFQVVYFQLNHNFI